MLEYRPCIRGALNLACLASTSNFHIVAGFVFDVLQTVYMRNVQECLSSVSILHSTCMASSLS
jgi:hypothetical protein